MVRILAMIVLAAGPLCAAAHGIYIAPRAGSPTLVLGHGAEDLGYDADKVTELRAFDRAGHEVALSREHARRQFSFRLPAETAVVSATYYGGYHGKTADGDWKAGPRGAHAGVARVGEYFKSTLFVAQHAARWPDAQLAIVPLQDVLGLRAGQQLTVRVSFAGRPLAGARVVGDYVNASHQVSAQTDANGLARITLRSQGLNVLAVTHRQTQSDERADFRENVSTLSFVLPYRDRH